MRGGADKTLSAIASTSIGSDMTQLDERPTTTVRWPDRPTTAEGWTRRAAEVAALFGTTAAERDAGAIPPRPHEIAWIKESGLAQLLGPIDAGGAAAEWSTAVAVVREFAKVEGSIANIVAWHYCNYWVLQSFTTPDQQRRWEHEVTASVALLAPVANFHDTPVTARDAGDHLVLNGVKAFNTGAPSADLIVVGVALEGTDSVFFLLVDARSDGITFGADWDTLGQRGTGSGSVRFTDVTVDWSRAIGFDGRTFVPRQANHTPGVTGQIMIVTMYNGLARGALDRGVAYIRERSRPWLHSDYEAALDDPYIQRGIGELQSRLLGAEVFAAHVADRVSEAVRTPDEITDEERGELAVLISSAKVVSVEVALQVTNGIFEFTGARSTARSVELDRHLRDVRTHTLHDPVAYKILQVGQHSLSGTYPHAVDWYA